jgi:serine/threonine-protein kinase
MNEPFDLATSRLMPEASCSPLDCPAEASFVDLLAGQLPPAEADDLKAHLERCRACSGLVDALRSLATEEAEPTGSADAATAMAFAREMADETTSRAGAIVDRKYRLVRWIGCGGMGVVYEALHTGTGRQVAVKLLHGRLRERGRDAERRFRREARAACVVGGRHFVEVFDAGEDEATGELYIVMALLRGEDLQRLVRRVGALLPDVALLVAAEALAGLARLHGAGIVHRDIKPANLFLAVEEDGEVSVKVLDFGLAKLSEGGPNVGPSAELTGAGGVLGSPLYMSPEQVESSTSVDHRTDLWSLGSALYFALTGRAPFEHVENIMALAVAIHSSTAPPVRELAPWVPPELGKVVRRALEVDPAKRFSSASEMAEAIHALLPGGSSLRREMLVGISAEARAEATPLPMPGAPKADASDDAGSPGERSRGFRLQTAGGSRRSTRIVVSAAALLAVAASGLVAVGNRESVATPSPPSSAEPAPAAAAAQSVTVASVAVASIASSPAPPTTVTATASAPAPRPMPPLRASKRGSPPKPPEKAEEPSGIF